MTVDGIDLSQYQALTPPLAGMGFVFARATYDTHPDSRFAQHMGAAKDARLVTGAYHFATGRSAVPAQAAAFLSAAGGAQLLAVDFEQDAVPATAQQVAALIAAIRASDPRKRKVGLYHSESGFPDLGQDFDWVAHWGVAAPSRPWQFHQYTSSGSVPGYSGRLDLDRFNGTRDQLLALAGVAAPASPSWRLHVESRAVVTYAVLTPDGKAIASYATKVAPSGSWSGAALEERLPGAHSGHATVYLAQRRPWSGYRILPTPETGVTVTEA